MPEALLGEQTVAATPEDRVSVTRSGQGPPVLLLNGWEGRASDDIVTAQH